METVLEMKQMNCDQLLITCDHKVHFGKGHLKNDRQSIWR